MTSQELVHSNYNYNIGIAVYLHRYMYMHFIENATEIIIF